MSDSSSPRTAYATQHKSWIHWLAFGLGTGTSPKAPGTIGSAAALLFLPVLAQWAWPLQLLWVAVTFVFGVWICDRTAKDLQVHDHPGIVWDEFVGIWLVFIAVPLTPMNVMMGLVLFRLFDVLKPWPIGLLDRHVKGGFGIMIDDVLAGIFAFVLLQLWIASGWGTTLF
ncbi:MAG: phosphatidylglycerophosphatase A [Natronospirillum sp.]